MEPDFFVSDADLTLDSLPTDALEHGRVAARLVSQMERMGSQSVMSIEGSWGSGKSDLMARMFLEVKKDKREGVYAFWINPWQYGTTDLLTPLVSQMADRMRTEKRNEEAIRSAIRIVLLAGINFGVKAAAGPFAPTLEAILNDKDFKKLLDRMTSGGPEEKPPVDPVAGMAQAFCKLVDALAPEQPVEKRMVFVFVDDIDRCLPDRQVAMLEALRFLLSSGARARFVVAMDPALATEALAKHFRVEELDTERFLDKLFHVRFHLPTLVRKEVADLIVETCKAQMRRSDGIGLAEEDKTRRWLEPGDPIGSLTKMMFSGRQGWDTKAAEVFVLDGLNNPRTIGRAVRRLGMFAAVDNPKIDEPLEKLFFAWLALSVRWPEARRAFQYLAVNDFYGWDHYLAITGQASSKSSDALVPDPLSGLKFHELGNNGAFRTFFSKVFENSPMSQCRQLEKKFREAGI